MLNSLLILGSTYNKNKKLNIIFAISWILFMILGSNLTTEIGIRFTIMNFIAFVLVFGLGKLFKGRYSNKIVAILSVLIWSVVIDIVCYFLYPQFTMGQNIFIYICNGILFNYKYVFYNVLMVAIVNLVPLLNKALITNKLRNRLQLNLVKN